ncbi:MAG: hypothetical protein J6129_05825 [Bacteroidaceae bacterium]|nr:hypothetical protein [Bacteroidaceae bacterium]
MIIKEAAKRECALTFCSCQSVLDIESYFIKAFLRPNEAEVTLICCRGTRICIYSGGVVRGNSYHGSTILWRPNYERTLFSIGKSDTVIVRVSISDKTDVSAPIILHL